MAAPKGNKNAVGSVNNGAPPKYDLEQEAADLLAWSKLPTSDSLYSFTYDKDYLACELSGFAERSVVFAKSLIKAKERIGRNRESMMNTQQMAPNVWNRNATVYDTMLHKHERAEKVFDAELKKETEKSTAPIQVQIVDYSKAKS